MKERRRWLKILWFRPEGHDSIPLIAKIMGTIAFLFNRYDENIEFGDYEVCYENHGSYECDYGTGQSWDTISIQGTKYTIYNDCNL